MRNIIVIIAVCLAIASGIGAYTDYKQNKILYDIMEVIGDNFEADRLRGEIFDMKVSRLDKEICKTNEKLVYYVKKGAIGD